MGTGIVLLVHGFYTRPARIYNPAPHRQDQAQGISLEDAYFHVQIHPDSQKYLHEGLHEQGVTSPRHSVSQDLTSSVSREGCSHRFQGLAESSTCLQSILSVLPVVSSMSAFMESLN